MTAPTQSLECLAITGKVLKAIREFTDNPDMPSQQVAIVLHVALYPGQTMNQIADAVGVSQSAISRNIARLGRGIKWNADGADLLKVEEYLYDRRLKVVNLSQRGTQMVASVQSKVVMKGASK